jgi:anti-sigma B factor antagonist
MSVRSRREGESVTVSVEGQLIAGNRQQLRDAVSSEIDTGARNFVIDFADTGYIDSAGLGALVSLSKKIREATGSLRLTNLNDDLRTLFELTRLDTLFVFEGPTGDGEGVTTDLTPTPRPPRSDAVARPALEDDARA